MTNPSLRSTLIVLLAVALAVWIGVGIAQEEYMLAFLISGGALLLLATVVTPHPIEAWVLGFLTFAYIVGNRGFAQLMPVPGLPAFFGELGLLFCGVVLALRGALRRELPYQRDAVNFLLFAWIILACVRIGFDLRVFGVVALRDFATVYYAFFFFVAQAAAEDERTRKLLRQMCLLAFAVLPLTAALVEAFPEFFLTKFTVKNIPVMFYKDDLVGTFLFAGFLLLLPQDESGNKRTWWRWGVALASLGVGLVQLSRAGMVGLAVGACWLAMSGRWRAFKVLIVTGVGGALCLTLLAVFVSRDVTRTRAYAVYEQVVSIVDLDGHRNYQNAETADSPDNNRFRIVWWRTIAEETVQNGPLFGQGFGYDLARGFLQVYNPLADDFTARSPHSVIFTNLGRLGFVGLGLFLALMGALASTTAQTARAVRSGLASVDEISLQAAMWVILVSACFGVVLEGPMGAIPFWIMAGLALRECANRVAALQAASAAAAATPASTAAAGTGASD